MLQSAACSPTARKHSISYAKYGYIFCMPFVLAFLVFSLYPIIYTITISFSDLKGMGTASYNILPDLLGNFKSVLTNNIFQLSLQSTAIMWICNFIPQICLALLLAAWFTNTSLKIRGQGMFKILVYMPSIITAAWSPYCFFNFSLLIPRGAINNTLVRFGILEAPVDFPRDPAVARGIVSFIQFWMWYGNTMVVLVAGILGINPALFQAASIDGASGFQTFFRITIPCIALYTAIYAGYVHDWRPANVRYSMAVQPRQAKQYDADGIGVCLQAGVYR